MHRYNKRLGKNALMTPHMMVWVCRYCTEPGNNCKQVGQTIYCPPPTISSRLPGSAVIDMGLEELCIYNTYKDKDNAEKWWEYMENVYHCRDKGFLPDCVASAKAQTGIDKKKLNDCLGRSGDILLGEYLSWQSSNVPYNPAIVINNHVYRVRLPIFFPPLLDNGRNQKNLNRVLWMQIIYLRAYAPGSM